MNAGTLSTTNTNQANRNKINDGRTVSAAARRLLNAARRKSGGCENIEEHVEPGCRQRPLAVFAVTLGCSTSAYCSVSRHLVEEPATGLITLHALLYCY